jgi:hypothetical protein
METPQLTPSIWAMIVVPSPDWTTVIMVPVWELVAAT